MNNDATTIIITTCDGKVLLQKRDNNPAIEHPGAYSLFSGYINDNETPLQAIEREISEELSQQNGKPIRHTAIKYLGSIQRYDYKRYDYIHHAILLNSPGELALHEGTGLVALDYEHCLAHPQLAPHHKAYLQRYSTTIHENQNVDTMRANVGSNPFENLIKLQSLHKGKSLPSLECGLGFYDGNEATLTSLIHFVEDIKFAAFLQFQPNQPRGNHYHLKKIEYMLILDGEMRVDLKLKDDHSTTANFLLKRGDLLAILPGVIHTFTATSKTPVPALEFSPQRFLSSDVFKLSP